MKSLAIRNIAVVGIVCAVMLLITTALPDYHDRGFSLLGSFLLPVLYGGAVYVFAGGTPRTRFGLVAITPVVYFLILWVFGYLKEVEEPAFILIAFVVLELVMLTGAAIGWARIEKRARRKVKRQTA